MGTILEINSLRKTFGEKTVVNGLSFKVNEGEILGFLGPNGAGKSTTISMITTILDFDEGKVLFEGREVNSDDNDFKKILGYVPQNIALFNDLSAYENVKFFGSLYGLKGSYLNNRVNETLELVGLYDRKNDYPDSFSGGMKRRLNIACSIVHKPKILIMDEPTVGIDPQSRNNILEVVKSLRDEGTTIIYTSHYMEEVEAICNRIIILDNGQIVEFGYKDEIKTKYRSKGLNNLEEIFLYITGKELRD
ncbi:ABC transporter ATP-binding protein [Paraclostridium sordellii]|uniref:ABC transporter ATP-binding protein n=2 Tax=Paraclostridium sordellii TaxID=1505 RepID=UPI0005E936BB|nr:ABC transporter ATP-binding protein [Paeniclostridium sordellii]MDU4413193.1 ABC transporter ATP-binding protein [Paeniclostridium sordellii]MDU6483625.1 ABC transporter ATP-binding protein [Paeniclostridium sordellii]MVO74883.1 ATP-binding cassette domain-containing protein [Paeniclostridium sordellii]CEN83548.1 sulfate-transporting ATPase [[Clostridium] sordellii] [Paeniclostridium sordellii]CEO10642.1 sulfate-transporting ATPase [[Clostridium] sordellii] [Paeniclostridium sordellii]